jgi:hypothetical protein
MAVKEIFLDLSVGFRNHPSKCGRPAATPMLPHARASLPRPFLLNPRHAGMPTSLLVVEMSRSLEHERAACAA